MQTVGSSSIVMNVTASTGRDVSWLALCRLSWPRLRLTSKRDAKPSAGRKGRELSKQSGRGCSQCWCKYWQTGKAQRDAESSLQVVGMGTASPGWTLVSMTLSKPAPLPKERGFMWWAPYLEVSREVTQWGCSKEDVPSLRTPLNIPWSHPVKKHPLGSVRTVPWPSSCVWAPDGDAGRVWYREMQRGMLEHSPVSPVPLEESLT